MAEWASPTRERFSSQPKLRLKHEMTADDESPRRKTCPGELSCRLVEAWRQLEGHPGVAKLRQSGRDSGAWSREARGGVV